MIEGKDKMMNPTTPAEAAQSSLAPFSHAAYSVLWAVTVVSNIGTWMQNAAAGWLMTSLDPDPFTVSLVQVAGSLAMFVFALPAGALADIVDRRRLLISIQIGLAALVALFGVMVWMERVSPTSLLIFSFLAATGAALITPAWQSIVPQLVSPAHLQAAVALNSVGVNVSRAVGPALAGLIIAVWGLAAPYWLNALTALGVISGLVWWKPEQESTNRLPPERFNRAIQAGLRHARHNPHLRATLIRAAGVFLFASAYWALLPLVARDQVAGGPKLYGILLGAIGASAVAGAFLLPTLKRYLDADRLMAAGTLGTAIALALFGVARHPATALAASTVAGASWIAVLATVNVSAQVALPGWVRGRGLSIFGMVMFGGLTVGSAVWGKLASLAGLPATHLIAAAGALVTIPLLWRWKLQTGAGLDLTPSMHWPEVIPVQDVGADRGPVLVTVEYNIRPEDRVPFFAAVNKFADERRRDGAFEWNVFEDLSASGRFVETFLLDSWLDHLRQHRRVTGSDRGLQEAVNRFQVEGTPKVNHFISGGFGSQSPK
jgi:MFS family permease